MKRLLLMTLLPVLLASPAWADYFGCEDCLRLPVLSGRWTISAQDTTVTITTSQFSGHGSDVNSYLREYGGIGSWTYQGQTYNYVYGHSAPGVFALVNWEMAAFVDTTVGGDTVPATMEGVIFFRDVSGANFHFTGTGTAHLNGIGGGVRYIDFGSADPTVQTPEPSTWLLLGSGLVGLILWRKRTA